MLYCSYGCGKIGKYKFKNGKLCCSNSQNKCEAVRNKISDSLKGSKHSDETKRKISVGNKGKTLSDETKRKIGEKNKGNKRSDLSQYNKKHKKTQTKSNNPNWKGGYYTNNIPLYDTYAHQISFCESIRKNKQDINILEVKCAYCGKWYVPKQIDVSCRIQALAGRITIGTENRLYCSEKCKQECPVYNQRKWPKGFKPATSREVQPELRQMCFKRDNFTCQKCGKPQDELDVGLHCHHIEGIRWEPLESADLDKVITFCKTCHKEVHKLLGCGYQDLKCKEGD